MTPARLRRSLPSLRLVSLFVLAGFLPVAILTWGSLAFARSALTKEASTRMATAVADAQIKIGEELTATETAAAALAQVPEVIAALRSGSPARASAIARGLDLTRPDWQGIVLVGLSGTVLAADPTVTMPTAGTSIDPGWLTQARLARGVHVVGAVLPSGPSSIRSIAVTAAVHDGQDVVGYLLALTTVSSLQSGVNENLQVGHLEVTIADQNGDVVAAPGLSPQGLTTAATGLPASPGATGPGGLEQVVTESGSGFVGHGTVPGFGWTVTASLAGNEAYAGMTRLRHTVLTLAAWLLASMLLGLLLLARREQSRRRDDEVLAHRSRELMFSERQFRTAFISSPVGMVRIDLAGIILETNPAFTQLMGYADGALVGVDIQDVTHPDDRQITAERIRKQDFEGEVTRLEKRYLHVDGRPVWVLLETCRLTDLDGVDYLFAQVLDISDRKSAEETLSRQALQDPLTGLANRLHLEDRITEVMAGWTSDAELSPAVLFVDLDGFKSVNDSLGHRAGDEVLREIAERLLGIVRPHDIVCRLGGDEFVVLCTGLPSRQDPALAQIAERIVAAVSRPALHDGQRWQVGASVGCAWPRRHGESASSLLSRADEAMYQAKRLGKGRLAFADDLDDPEVIPALR